MLSLSLLHVVALITFANSLDADPDQQNPDPNSFHTLILFLKELFGNSF